MKKIVITFYSFILLFPALYAQSSQSAGPGIPPPGNAWPAEGTPAEKAKAQTDRLNEIVQLPTEQYARVFEIVKNYFEVAFAANGGNKAARLASLSGQQKKEMLEKIKAVLSPVQWQKFQAAVGTNDAEQGQTVGNSK